MSEFVAMTCPNCGGELQVKKDLQKYFCMYCGTELVLKQDSQGMFSTIRARDLQASAKLKEIQFSMATIELVKSQIVDIEKEIKRIRQTFLDYYPKIYKGALYTKFFSDYQKANKIPIKISDVYVENMDKWSSFIEGNIPGYTTANELLRFMQVLQSPKYKKDKYVTMMLAILEPLPSLAEQLDRKKAQLNNMLEQAIE